MNLIIDIGNSRVKLYVFHNNNILYSIICNVLDLRSTLEYISVNYSISKAILSNVSTNQNVYQTIELFFPVLVFSHQTKIPISNNYATPSTLGLDRIASAIGAVSLAPNKPILVIDAGTAITIDYISESACFEGGNISLGMQTRFKALHEFTGNLPLIEPLDSHSVIGINTKEAISNGVVQGIIFEIDSYITAYQEKFSDIQIFLCGGDANYFAEKLKNRIFVEPNLLAIGLLRILEYNETI